MVFPRQQNHCGQVTASGAPRSWEFCISVSCLLSHTMLTYSANIDRSKLPEDILLEIFDAYREIQPLKPKYERYEHAWNSEDGWFKLTHVCRSWRRLVHFSPSRLHVHLLFTPCRSSRATMLRDLPPFPILIDYSHSSWVLKDLNLALAAIGHRDRVHGIALPIPHVYIAKFLKALSHPFPVLESLDISKGPYGDELNLPATFLSGSAPCLRRLVLHGVGSRCLSPLLSSATGLVELSLTFNTEIGSPPAPLLLADLQRLSRLRCLDLKLVTGLGVFHSDPPTLDVVPLSKLMHLNFKGPISYLETLVVGLAAPSLQSLEAKLDGQPSHTFPIPHLCKFIRDAEFTSINLNFSSSSINFRAGIDCPSLHDRRFEVSLPGHVSLTRMGQELSGLMFIVEELIITWDDNTWYRATWHSTWRIPSARTTRSPFWNFFPPWNELRLRWV
ncbi:hypothetical protein EI94DRAFT_899548 [Lactarius quietus]|nr:hypothetical protein EI94DRAFT_899548 [Lactarius quietus]